MVLHSTDKLRAVLRRTLRSTNAPVAALGLNGNDDLVRLRGLLDIFLYPHYAAWRLITSRPLAGPVCASIAVQDGSLLQRPPLPLSTRSFVPYSPCTDASVGPQDCCPSII